MINKTLKELKQEFHYFKTESKLDSNSIERINRLEHVLTTSLEYYSSIDNKYILAAKKELLNKINSNLKVCMINKNRILSEMDTYSLDFGNTKLDAFERRIEEYNIFLNNLDKLYTDTLASETNYNQQDMTNLYNDCVTSINSKKENIKFLGKKLDEYSASSNQNKLISKLYSYISDKEFIKTFSYIVNIKNKIKENNKYIDDLEFIKNNKKYIEKYDIITKSSTDDLNYIIEKSYICDNLNNKLKERNKSKLLKNRVFNVLYNKLLKQIDNEELNISKRNIVYRKKERYLSKVSMYFSKNGFKVEELLNYLWIDNDMLDTKIINYKNDIQEKELLLVDYINGLSDRDRDLYFNYYDTIENIITTLCNNYSNMVNIYILYILSDLNNIIKNNKEICYDDCKTNDIVSKYVSDCNNKMIEIDTNKSIQKLKKLDII